MRRSRAIRATAWGVVAAGALAPLVRKRVPLPPLLTQAVAFAAPVGLCVAVRRSRARDIATCSLQMWAYLAAYKSPHDDPEGQERRVRIDYPIAIDRALGLGELPTVRLQRALARVGPEGPRWRALDRVLVWAHWSWFLVPHGGLLYILLVHPRRFDRAAVLTYAVFDIGAMIYWVLPTAPPWYAAAAPEGGGGRNEGSAHAPRVFADAAANGHPVGVETRVGIEIAAARHEGPARREVLGEREGGGECEGAGGREGAGECEGAGGREGAGECEGAGGREGAGECEGAGGREGAGECEGAGGREGAGECEGAGGREGAGECEGAGGVEGVGECSASKTPPRASARVCDARGGVFLESTSAGTAAPRRTLAVRRIMVEFGEDFWEDNWASLYSVLGGNPLAAMPSLHFATSVMAAQLLAETGPVAGALGWAYASTLGLALVYLGEHYAIDLIAGAALTAAVRRLGPRAGPLLARGGRAVAALEAKAHEAG